jgi:CII-binding regulator of phage lambda lysogenization HflD
VVERVAGNRWGLERLVAGVGPRFDAIDARLSGLEGRLTGLERRLTAVETSVDVVARNAHRIEQAIADSNFRIEQMLSDILARLP